ncbi:MAG: SLBB domain-containing protein [Chthonomonadales bacterium]|nr:SLBB domain-containing protein [Chthonomonadales bacterium]
MRTAIDVGLVVVWLLVAGTARADLGALDPLARPTTRIGPGFTLALDVSVRGTSEEELCGQFALDGEARLQLTIGRSPIDRVRLDGATASEARARILAAIRKFFAVEPEVRVGIARIPRIRVLVEGATFRSGPLSLPVGARLSDALASTGYHPNADLERIEVRRIDADGSHILLRPNFAAALERPGDNARNDPLLRMADRIVIPVGAVPVQQRTVVVLGDVKRPGTVPYRPGMAVRDALENAQGLLPSADVERVVIRRLKGNEVLTVNAERALALAPTDNLALQPDDTVVVATRDSGLRYAVVGEVAAPRTFDYSEPVPLMRAIGDAGGLKPQADRRNVVVIRGMLRDPAAAQPMPVDLDRIARGETPDIVLGPGDMVQVSARRKASSPLIDIGMFLLRLFVF